MLSNGNINQQNGTKLTMMCWAVPPKMALISRNLLSHQCSNHVHMEHVKLLEIELQRLSFCLYLQQFQLEGYQTVKGKLI